ncbi:hypothetical protein CVT24_012137 [Panaeolus cyanescens]|uniref:RNase H type-1 domain-containing protein n=1 Tax=Panaeolus cyanescens TaxID=181874 RepID=A0A409YYT7_9AGAR|nr:hypothetical protein CVT24_012137 [Panaeolus cyanescens]
MWVAGKMVLGNGGDGTRARIPPLAVKDDGRNVRLAVSNEDQGKAFFEAFFPKRTAPRASGGEGEYPRERWKYETVTDEEISEVIRSLKPYKKSKSGTPPNSVFINARDILTPYLGPIFRATDTTEFYPSDWKITETPILRKPGKSDYTTANAYRPIGHVEWLRRRNEGRRTVLCFDDYSTEEFDVEDGLDQGEAQSLILYLLYNAKVPEMSDKKRGVTVQAFVDDVGIVATGKDFNETHNNLKNTMEKPQGVLEWAESHNCTFGIEKFQLLDATRRKSPNPAGRGKQRGLAQDPYGIETFHPPNALHETKKGSAFVKKLDSILGRAAVMIVGGLSTSPRDVAMVHAGLERMDLAITKANYRAALRLCTLPKEHPLYKPAATASKRCVKRFPTPIHHLLNAFDLNFERTEKVQPRYKLEWDKRRVTVEIAEDREEAIGREEEEWTRGSREWKIYSDGSAMEGKVGAAAVIYRGGEEKRAEKRRLGSARYHTVYEAKVVGLEVATRLALEKGCRGRITFGLDNQAVLATLRGGRAHTAQAIWGRVHANVRGLLKQDRQVELCFRWVPGHEGIEGNERADQLAKEATVERRGDKLPRNRAALWQDFKNSIKLRRRQEWEESPRFQKIDKYDNTMPSRRYERLVKMLQRKQASMIFQLRTGHAPLAKHLHNMGKTDSPTCKTLRTRGYRPSPEDK